jgi:hypothetical protein
MEENCFDSLARALTALRSRGSLAPPRWERPHWRRNPRLRWGFRVRQGEVSGRLLRDSLHGVTVEPVGGLRRDRYPVIGEMPRPAYPQGWAEGMHP